MFSTYLNRVVSVEYDKEEGKLFIRTEYTVADKIEHVSIVFTNVFAFSLSEWEKTDIIIDEIADGSILGFLGWYYSERYFRQKAWMEAWQSPALSYGGGPHLRRTALCGSR